MDASVTRLLPPSQQQQFAIYSYSGRGDPALTNLAECAEALFIRR